ncbi:MAG: hypothetical protein JWM14_3057 [Chitinophagaceae bacterium]|nr:hypothetical protein [Chitinophagaceae bacterium]
MGKQLLAKAFFLCLLLSTTNLYAQLTPFSLPPKWYFGHRAGLDFTSGSPVGMAGNTWDGGSPNYDNQEGATTDCFPNSNVAYYSNSCALKDATHTYRGPNPLLGGGNSSTQGVISFPNPSSPTNKYFMANARVDPSGGSNCAQSSHGIYVYPVDASVVPLAVGAPTLLSAGAASSTGPGNESIAVGSDMAGGYWIVSIDYNSGTGNCRFVAWNVDSTGTINTTPVYSPVVISSAWSFQPQASVNISKCQTRIAYLQKGAPAGSEYVVCNWDPVNGVSTGIIRAGSTGNAFNYGCELSPDGNVLYVTGLDAADALRQIVIASGANNVVAATNLGPSALTGWGNLKLGPDNKIYVSHSYSAAEGGPKYIGVIGTPNGTTAGAVGYVATGYTLGAGALPSTQNGLISLSWHNPFLTINNSSATNCMDFSHTFNQYYGTAIPVLANSEEWDFGHGGGWQTGLGATPTHTFPSNKGYTVKLRLKDSYCQNFYATQRTVVVNCVLPVELVSFKARKDNGGVLLNWQTAIEINNDYFEIMRSTDGITFQRIGIVDGSGNSKTLLNYSFFDDRATGSQIYYKLIQHDFDGASDASNIVTVQLDKAFNAPIAIAPNPFNESFVLTKFNDEKASVIVYDLLGRIVEQKSSSETELVIQLGAGLSNGTYIVEYITAESSYTARVEKQ